MASLSNMKYRFSGLFFYWFFSSLPDETNEITVHKNFLPDIYRKFGSAIRNIEVTVIINETSCSIYFFMVSAESVFAAADPA
jgi:hypothetical protein